ncbi:uncharacterized protein [Notamacropus eugenii]|uniref:uncharacterized protein n=1 Tax=Notamacropus eugenii TaxID=9315 RepID=UPI003B66EAFB
MALVPISGLAPPRPGGRGRGRVRARYGWPGFQPGGRGRARGLRPSRTPKNLLSREKPRAGSSCAEAGRLPPVRCQARGWPAPASPSPSLCVLPQSPPDRHSLPRGLLLASLTLPPAAVPCSLPRWPPPSSLSSASSACSCPCPLHPPRVLVVRLSWYPRRLPSLTWRTCACLPTMPVNLGPAFLLLSAAILASLSALLWMMGCRWFKKNIHETTADDHDFASENYTDTSLSVRDLSKEILQDCPHAGALQQKILLNLSVVEYKLLELHQFLLARGLSTELKYRHIS